jgi:hypothetical protein
MNCYIQLCKVHTRTLLAYMYFSLTLHGCVTAMKLRSAVLTFPLVHVITVIISYALPRNA